jgi:hypothetical protein
VAVAGALMSVIVLLDMAANRTVLPGNYLYVGQRWGVGPPTLAVSAHDPAGVARGAETSIWNRSLALLGVCGGCWVASALLAEYGGGLLAFRRWVAEPRTLVRLAFGASVLSVLTVSALIGRLLMDRYVLLLCPLAIPLCMRPGPIPKSRLLASLIACVLLAAVAYGGVVDYWRWNAARWQATAWLESRGVSPECIDGGYEYNGLRDTLGIPSELMSAQDRERERQILAARRRKPVYTIRFGPSPGQRTIARFAYKTPLYPVPQYIYVTQGYDGGSPR